MAPLGTLPGTLSATESSGGVCFSVDGHPVAWPPNWSAKQLSAKAYAVVDSTGKTVATSGTTVTLGGGFLLEAAQYCPSTSPAFTAYEIEPPTK
ncbi:MAG: hypothetical protein QOF57_2509 [Frankiaceae bacterium]|nr:hypothetical protein [Frankiaceae bacterium]